MGELLSVDLPAMTIALCDDGGLELAMGTRLGVTLPEPQGQGCEPRESGEVAVQVVADEAHVAGLRIVTLDILDRVQMQQLEVGSLRTLLNERESFRTPVHPGTVVSSRISPCGPEGRPAKNPFGAILLDASFDGLGVLVGAQAAAQLQTTPFVHVGILTPEDGEISVVGVIRHDARVLRGARLGIAAGVVGADWPESDENRLRQFVLGQQRLELARKRGD